MVRVRRQPSHRSESQASGFVKRLCPILQVAKLINCRSIMRNNSRINISIVCCWYFFYCGGLVPSPWPNPPWKISIHLPCFPFPSALLKSPRMSSFSPSTAPASFSSTRSRSLFTCRTQLPLSRHPHRICFSSHRIFCSSIFFGSSRCCPLPGRICWNHRLSGPGCLPSHRFSWGELPPRYALCN